MFIIVWFDFSFPRYYCELFSGECAHTLRANAKWSACPRSQVSSLFVKVLLIAKNVTSISTVPSFLPWSRSALSSVWSYTPGSTCVLLYELDTSRYYCISRAYPTLIRALHQRSNQRCQQFLVHSKWMYSSYYNVSLPVNDTWLFACFPLFCIRHKVPYRQTSVTYRSQSALIFMDVLNV